MPRPHVILSVAMSIDGYIDDATDTRLLLSNEADFDRVDEVRASVDAIMIGATTIRRDNPRLLVNSQARRAARVAAGKPEYPLKATITGGGDLTAEMKFFNFGGDKVVYCASPNTGKQAAALDGLADVVDAGDPLSLGTVLDDLGERGVQRLMVEGGSTIHTQFLTVGLADELHLAVAPFFVGDPAAPRFVNAGQFPQDSAHRMTVGETRLIGDIVFTQYLIER